MMKKGLTFTSLTTGTSFTYNVPHFNSLLEAQQYLINIAVNISQIACSNVNGGVNTSLISSNFMSAIPDDISAYISINDTTTAGNNNTCKINGNRQYVQVYKTNNFNLDADSYDLQGNVFTLTVIDGGASSVSDGVRYSYYWGYSAGVDGTQKVFSNISFACMQNSNNSITPNDIYDYSEGLALFMPCTYTLTDNTLVFAFVNLVAPVRFMGDYDFSTRKFVPKNASYYANYVYKLTYPIIPPRPEQPTISGDVTDDINTETGASDTNDSENNVGGNGNVTLINNVVNYDNYTPNYARVNTGFITAFKVTDTELNTLHSFLYGETVVDLIKNYFAGDATKAIVDLFNIPLAPQVEANSTEIKVGVVPTGAHGNVLSSETVTFDFGGLDITQGYNSNTFMDLDPYNKYMIYLPFIGFRNLNTNDIRSINDTGFKIYLKYVIDMLTGDFVAVIEADHNNAVFDNDTGEVTTAKLTKQVINTFSGNMRTAIPLTSINAREMLNTGLGAITGAVASIATGNPLTMAIGAEQSLNSMASYNNALIPRGDNLSGNLGNLTINKAFIINQEAPKYIRTGKSNQFAGYPVFKYLKITPDRGFVKVKNVIMSNFAGTASEQARLEELLKKGVRTK